MTHLLMLAMAPGCGHSESAAMPQLIQNRSCLQIRPIPQAQALLSMGRCFGPRSGGAASGCVELLDRFGGDRGLLMELAGHPCPEGAKGGAIPQAIQAAPVPDEGGQTAAFLNGAL